MTHSLLGNLGLNIIVPVLIMTQFTDRLGALPALLVALAFPLVYGLWDWWKERTVNTYSALGILSVVLTGFIGVLALPAKYLAFKEASIPLIIALVFVFSSFTKFDATTKILEQVLDIKKLHTAFKKNGRKSFSKPLIYVRWAFIISFLFSAIANYVLAVVIVTAAPATAEFTQQVGTMTAFAFPVIVVPVMLLFVVTLYVLFKYIEHVTGRSHEEFLVPIVSQIKS